MCVCVDVCLQSALNEELEITTDGSDIYVSRKTDPFVICAISLTSAAVKADGKHSCQLHRCFVCIICSEIKNCQNGFLTPLCLS